MKTPSHPSPFSATIPLGAGISHHGHGVIVISGLYQSVRPRQASALSCYVRCPKYPEVESVSNRLLQFCRNYFGHTTRRTAIVPTVVTDSEGYRLQRLQRPQLTCEDLERLSTQVPRLTWHTRNLVSNARKRIIEAEN